MQLFDVHNHLQDERLDDDRAAVLARAAAAGVARMAVCGTTEADWPEVQALATEVPGVIPCYGLHPWWIAQRTSGWLEALAERLKNEPAAVGEVGLDHALKDRDDADQESVFVAQIELSHELKRPVAIHCRRAWTRMMELLREAGSHPVGYLLHAYSGGGERVQELASLNAWFSFGGSLTFPSNRRGPRALVAVPHDRILLETDAPDIPPAGSERCEPGHIRQTLSVAADHLGLNPEELAYITYKNAERLFAGLLP